MRIRAVHPCAALLLALLAGAGPAPTSPLRIHTLDGAVIRGRIVALAPPTLTLLTDKKKKRALPVEQLERIVRASRGPAVPAGPLLVLADGDLVPLTTIAPGTEGGLRPSLGPGELPEITLECIKAFRCRGRAPGDEVFTKDATGPRPRDRDLLYLLREGRVVKVAGTINRIDSTRLSFDFAGKERSVSFERVYGAVIASDKPAPASTTVLPNRIHLTGGGRLTGEVLAADATVLELRHPTLGALRIAWDQTAEVEFGRDRLLALTEVKPLVSKAIPAFDRTWPVARHRTVDGNPLRIRGKTYARGLCCIPARTFTWAIPPGFTRFRAVLGIADETRGAGAALFEVLADDRSLFKKVLTGTGPAAPISLSVKGAKRLTIRIDFGPRLHLGDHCIIARPRLIAAKKE